MVALGKLVDGKPPDGAEAKARNGELELLPDQTNDVDGVANVLTKEGTSLPLASEELAPLTIPA